MKKNHKIEVSATAENIAALKAANIDFTLYEEVVVKEGSGDFANGSNFPYKEIILKAVTEMDGTDYDAQVLRNYCSGLQKNLYGKSMEKIIKL